jgi:hypothetical protein
MILLNRIYPALVVCVLATVVTAIPAKALAVDDVRLIIDYNDGVQVHFKGLKTKEKATVVDLLKAAENHTRGIKSTVRGSGQTALVTSIGDVNNEGGGRDAKNWLFYINDKRSEVGAGFYELRPKDAIMWKFDTLREEQ